MMKNILPIIKKELRSYFNSPIAYIVVVTFAVPLTTLLAALFPPLECGRINRRNPSASMQPHWSWRLLSVGCRVRSHAVFGETERRGRSWLNYQGL